MDELRRIGVHEIVLPNGDILHQAVVEIMNDFVVNYYEFRDELPMVEWFGGTIEVMREEEGLTAYQNGKRIMN
ncbi:MAG: hypothetical protein K5854_09200 [Prevotella sp.]|jgi:hypothetical protein|nr:hypothetical protein [Prevotella sp.]